MDISVRAMSAEDFKKLSKAIAKSPSTKIFDEREALEILNRENVKTKEDYVRVCSLYPSGEPAIEPSTYTPKPPGDDTPQWIWDEYYNGGRTS